MCLADNRDVRRVVEESVSDKQVVIAHVIASPVPEVYGCLGVDALGTIDILILSSPETTIITANITTRASNIQIRFLGRFTGSVMVIRDMESVDTALRAVNNILSGLLGPNVAEITRT